MKAARASAEQLQLEVERLKSEAAEACIGDFVCSGCRVVREDTMLVAGAHVESSNRRCGGMDLDSEAAGPYGNCPKLLSIRGPIFRFLL